MTTLAPARSKGLYPWQWQAEARQRAQEMAGIGVAPDHWRDWIPALFPALDKPFGERHEEFYNHIDGIRPGIKPPAFFAIWPRGGTKTTSVEVATVRLGARQQRKFCLYVRGIQDKANESVQNIAAKLESKTVERWYPDLSSRKVGKYNNSKGWRVDTLRCANDFNVVGLGLDAAVRGIKIEEYRPDLIIFDDIDAITDSAEAVQKKINVITKSILPAGSNDVAIIGIQNLIHPDSIFNMIAENRADFLLERIVSGPYPAVTNLTYERGEDKRYHITGGVATWAGQPLEICEQQINEWGLSAFLQEAQHEVEPPPGGIWDHIEFDHCTFSELPELVKGIVYVDPAVTDTDQSDSHGIQADVLGIDKKVYRLFSWEQRTSPEDSIKRATLKAVELSDLLKIDMAFGVETDQGGDLWKPAFVGVWNDLIASDEYPHITAETPRPRFVAEKAGSYGSKVHRNSYMLHDYERGNVVHVYGTHQVLERGLKRFPLTKPLDLVDAAFWSWKYLRPDWASVSFLQV